MSISEVTPATGVPLPVDFDFMRRFLASLVIAAAVVTGCAKETPVPPPPAQPAKPVQTGPVDGGRITIRLEADIDTLNPVLQTSEDERQVIGFLNDPLIDLDQNANPIPAVAAKWDVLDDGRTYVLHLDPRATFSDGKPVRASDVVFTLSKIVGDESTQFAGWFASLDLEKTKAVDERTVRVVFTEPRVAQLLAFNIAVLPEHVYGKGDFGKNRAVVGSGPYVLVKRETGRSIQLRRRADYGRAKPHIEHVVFRLIADDTVAWNALKRGDLDVGRVNNSTWQRGKDDPAVQQKLDFHNIYLLSYNCILWNLDDPKLNDVRVRRALAMSFDRRAVIERLYFGHARPVTGPFTPEQWANNPNVQAIEFNLQGAAALLSSAGWRDSDSDGILDRIRNGKPEKFELRLYIPAGNQPTQDQSQILQDALSKIGVKLEIAPVDGSTLFEHVLGRSFQAAFVAWVNEPDPDPYGLFHSSQVPPEGLNAVGYDNPEADQLIDAARKQFDRGRRTEMYHQLHEILARDQPYLWTVQVATKWAVNRRVQGVKPSTAGLGLLGWHPGPRVWWLK
jgi:peptide/nickel transport system substrate-binding protein